MVREQIAIDAMGNHLLMYFPPLQLSYHQGRSGLGTSTLKKWLAPRRQPPKTLVLTFRFRPSAFSFRLGWTKCQLARQSEGFHSTSSPHAPNDWTLLGRIPRPTHPLRSFVRRQDFLSTSGRDRTGQSGLNPPHQPKNCEQRSFPVPCYMQRR